MRSKVNIIFLYVTILSICSVALWQIISHGKALKAPAGISGLWIMTLSPNPVNDCPQAGLDFQDQAPMFTIRQSGPAIALTFNNGTATTLTGEIQDIRISARLHTVGEEIQLLADLHRDHNPVTLEGFLSFTGCNQTLQIPFQAFSDATYREGIH